MPSSLLISLRQIAHNSPVSTDNYCCVIVNDERPLNLFKAGALFSVEITMGNIEELELKASAAMCEQNELALLSRGCTLVVSKIPRDIDIASDI